MIIFTFIYFSKNTVKIEHINSAFCQNRSYKTGRREYMCVCVELSHNKNMYTIKKEVYINIT
jgi:hypothetical protein